ncbi:MAG TPA: ATP-binding cassette domain-containing protein [Rhizobiaceae bacterium]|nr:ATP-binding cassette domain-containing protein [Rhizobiaceae bacterium]
MTVGFVSRDLVETREPARTLVELSDLTKTYGPTCANDRVSLTIARGEIIGLVGGNGAGKSTLMRMLSGETAPDSGTITFSGKQPAAGGRYHAGEAQSRGIRIVHQELSLCDNLTVAENFYLEAPEGANGMPGWRGIYRDRARAALEAVFPNAGVNVDEQVSNLSIAVRQMVEIARALTAPGAEIVILDEPTSSLALDRSQQLRAYLRRRAAEGLAFIFISHKLHEIMDVASRVVVMRNGRVVWEGETGEASVARLVSLMGGDASLKARREREAAPETGPGRPMVRLTGRMRENKSDEIILHAGEIVGLAGLEGSGQRDLLHGIFSGSRDAGVALERGVTASFVSGDRQREGVFPLWNVLENISVTRIAGCSGLSLVNRREEIAAAMPAAERIRLDTGRFRSGILDLSGGNQQKALVARALACDAPVILLDDPTRGVDVAAKQDFYAVVAEIARAGRLVIWYSTEDLEFLECDRVLVFSHGRINRELTGDAIGEKAIVDASFERAGDGKEGAARTAQQTHSRAAERLVESAPFVSLAVVLAAMAWANPTSLSPFGLDLLLSPALSLVLVALGQMFIIGGSEIDLGAGAFAGVINVLSATILVGQPGLGVLSIAALLVIYAGLGALIQARRIPAIVVTLGASFIWLGIGYTLQPTPGGSSPEWLTAIFSVSFPLVPTSIVFILVTGLIAWFVNRTPVGVALRAFGNNPQAMARGGWSPIRYATIRYLFSGLFILAAGLSLTAINTASDINSGNSYTLLSVAAVVIGGCSLFGGRISPVGVVAGAITLSLIGALLGMLNVNSDYNAAVQGLLLLVILAFRALVARGGEDE